MSSASSFPLHGLHSLTNLTCIIAIYFISHNDIRETANPIYQTQKYAT